MSVIHVHGLDKFKNLLSVAKYSVIVKYSAQWCGPCKMIAPIFEALAADPKYRHTTFISVDIDESPDIAEAYDISSMPTFQLFKKGQLGGSFSGASKEKLEKLIRQ